MFYLNTEPGPNSKSAAQLSLGFVAVLFLPLQELSNILAQFGLLVMYACMQV